MTAAPATESALPRPRRWRRRLLRWGVAIFLVVNGASFVAAWTMTHYEAPGTAEAAPRSAWQKASLVATHLAMSRAHNSHTPEQWHLPYTTLHYPGAHKLDLETWRIPGEAGRPTVLMFHGYGGCKSNLLSKAQEFHAMGCETWMVDFHGNGGSAGTSTTIGYAEADDVLATIQQAATMRGTKQPLILSGTSMGAAAILCAIHRYHVQADALILECPYDRLVTTVGNRCRLLGLPTFPSADLVVFWGGLQQSFNGFELNPVDYAREVQCPALLLQGECDERVGLDHARKIATALGAHGTFDIFAGVGHGIPLGSRWRKDVTEFFAANRLSPGS